MPATATRPARFALELKRAKDDLAENEKQLALHEQAYQNNLLKIQHAVKKLDEVRHKISKYDAELKMSRAEAEMAAARQPVPFRRHDRLRPGRADDPGPDRQEPRPGAGRGRHVGRGRRGDPARHGRREGDGRRTPCANSRSQQGLVTPETAKATQSTKELGPAAKTLAAAPRDLSVEPARSRRR